MTAQEVTMTEFQSAEEEETSDRHRGLHIR